MTHSQMYFEPTHSPDEASMRASLSSYIGVHERQGISARRQRSHQGRAEVGGGFGTAPFGLKKVAVESPLYGMGAQVARYVPDDLPRDELGGHSPAEIVREAYALVDYGWTFTYVCNLWRTRDYQSPRGGTWSLSTVIGILRHPAMAGFATRRGEIVHNESGQRDPVHEPLVDPEVWDRVQVVRTRTRMGRLGVRPPGR